jgi:hypothetical protein
MKLKLIIRLATCFCTHAVALYFVWWLVLFKCQKDLKICWKCIWKIKLENEKEFLFISLPPSISAVGPFPFSPLAFPFSLLSLWLGRPVSAGNRRCRSLLPSLSGWQPGPTCQRSSLTSARSLGRSCNRRPPPRAHVLRFVGAPPRSLASFKPKSDPPRSTYCSPVRSSPLPTSPNRSAAPTGVPSVPNALAFVSEPPSSSFYCSVSSPSSPLPPHAFIF